LLQKSNLKQAVQTHKKQATTTTRQHRKQKNIFKNKIQYATSAIECLKNADCCILVTEWDEFKKLKPEDFAKNMKKPILIDGRRIYNPEEFNQKLKLTALGLGPRP